jgi:hypothetical protein
MSINRSHSELGDRSQAILGCALVGSLAILLLDALVLGSGMPYYSDGVFVLYQVAVHSITATPWHVVRPLQYLIVSAANYVYLPLWLGASLLCVVGATIFSALACERLFEHQLPKEGWWILGFANPLLFDLVSRPDIVSQALCDLFFAVALFAFVSEFAQSGDQPVSRLRADGRAVFLNLISAMLFFTKETGAAAAIVIPATAALLRFKARRLSPIFLFSMLLPIGAAVTWVWLRLRFEALVLPDNEGARYALTLSPLTWTKNLIVTLAMPVTPLPSSFLAFDSLRSVWIVIALISVILFVGFLLRAAHRRPKIIVGLLVVVASCAPMILTRADELYPSMIGPFAVAAVFIWGFSEARSLSLAYGILLYAASFGNAVVYCLGPDFTLFGLKHLEYSIYGKSYQFDPICNIATTAHVGWDGSATHHIPYAYRPDITGTITCIR